MFLVVFRVSVIASDEERTRLEVTRAPQPDGSFTPSRRYFKDMEIPPEA